MKPIKFSIAIVLKNPAGQILIVKRPPDDDRLPNVWGLPAVVSGPGETPEKSAIRVGLEKLNCHIKPIKFLGIKYADRSHFYLIMADIEAEIASGQPDVILADTHATKYTDQQWVSDLDLLRPGALAGDLCSQILLDKGFPGF